MANGDAAAAAGMDTVPGTADLRQGYDEINKTRDYLANHQTSGTHPASAINSGVLAEARIPDLPASKITGTLAAGQVPNLNASKITAGNITRPVSTSGNVSAGGSGRFGDAWNNNIVSTRRAVWMESDGTLGHTASSRRYKVNVRPLDIDLEGVLAIQPSTFEYRKGGSTDSGLIAEDLAEIEGAEFCISTNVDGSIEGIHYDRLTVILLALCQRQQQQIDELAERVAGLTSGEGI